MKGKCHIIFLIELMLVMTLGCKKPYLPPVIASNANYLVVEGVINSGQDSTIIRLSRTSPLSSDTLVKPELNAIVEVESNASTSYPLKEKGNGYYVSPGLNLNTSNKYQLKIITTDNKAYQSDFVAVKNSPPIDSVYYKTTSNNLQILSATHDPSNSTRYYRWEYAETYILHSYYDSGFIHVKDPYDTVLTRLPNQEIYTCWVSDLSSTIVLNSSSKLSKDVIANNSITIIPSTSNKIVDRYSILVKQYALTEDAYNYWQNLKKNTEQLGSIFDAQPSEISGNIHCVTTPSEPVIGFISVGSYSQSRIFIDNFYLPAWRPDPDPYYAGCYILPFLYFNPKTRENEVQTSIYSDIYIPVQAITTSGSLPKILGWTGAEPQCVDCTLRGTNIQPSFWINSNR
jgi:hypothetical protein